MLRTFQRLSIFVLFIYIGLLIFCAAQLFIAHEVYPYALVGVMSLLILSTFLSTALLSARFSPKVEMMLHLLGWINSVTLLLSALFPHMLKAIWNLNLGVAFVFPAAFFLSKVTNATTKLEKVLFYLTILNIILIEIGLLFKLSQTWYYALTASCLLLLTLVIVTNLVFYYVKRNQ
jgi:hypothetical protein